jgi:hypothetical protein
VDIWSDLSIIEIDWTYLKVQDYFWQI